MIRAIIRPRPRTRLWKWLDQWVKIPESSGGPNPGRLRTARFPIFRGIYDLAIQRHVHFLTLCSSARAGKTLFCICLVLYWIAERFGAVVWLDPTRNSARKLVRDEIDEFLLQCEPVRALAIITKKTWTTLEKHFRGKRFRLVGSGAEADMHGFNAELAIKNELDACRGSTDSDAASSDKIDARTKLFAHSRLIVDNSTPQKGEFGPTWQKFLRGSQHHCYLPCPHCSADRARDPSLGYLVASPFVAPSDEDVEPGRSPLSYDPRLAGWQRMTFFSETVPVPFDVELNMLVDADGNLPPRSQWREEVTGQASFERFAITQEQPRLDDPTQMETVRTGWNMKQVRRNTTYQCAYCKREIEQIDQSWMLARYRWMPHNPDAEAVSQDEENEDTDMAAGADEHISVHVWSWYSPFEVWGVIAAEFLDAKGDLGKLIKFFVYTCGKPFIHQGAAVKDDDITRAIARCPKRYLKGQIPLEAEELTMTIDRQGTELWYVIRAWGILWDVPGWPTWSALIDWGELASDTQIAEKAGLAPDPSGHFRTFTFTREDGTVRDYVVSRGLYDCGFEQQVVWDYCLTQSHWLSPSKGGDVSKTGGNTIRTTPVMNDELDLVWFWSDHFAADLYFGCILYGKTYDTPIHWWLPVNVDQTYRDHLTDERRIEENGKRIWKRRVKNDLGDCEKNQRVLADIVEDVMDDVRAERRELLEPKKKS